MLNGSGNIIRVHLKDIVAALPLGFQDFQGLGLIAGGDDSVGDLVLDDFCSGGIADIGEGNPVAEAAHPVSTTGTGIGAGQRAQFQPFRNAVHLPQHIVQGQAQGGAGRRNMLEAGGGGQAGGLLQLLHQLPAVEGIQQIDIPGFAVKHLDGQLALLHVYPGGFLVGIAAILQSKFLHFSSSHTASYLLMMVSSISPVARSMDRV